MEITSAPRAPATSSDLGKLVRVPDRGRPAHRLVTIGDSLTHGFQSGAIFNTDLSYPAIIAWELGWYDHFRRPIYPGFGGLPLNIEFVLRSLEERYGPDLSPLELPGAIFHLRQLLADVEQWWDQGAGSTLPPTDGPINHNLGIYGWDLRDVLSRTAETGRQGLPQPRGGVSIPRALVPLVRNADHVSAGRVLNSARGPDGEALTPLQAAAALSRDGTDSDPDGPGIETLIVLVGANNALDSVISLEVHWSGDGYDDLERKDAYNVWRPEHFEREWAQVVRELRDIRAQHVIVGTVPHVTIAPIARGVGTDKATPGSRYFRFYTRPWIADEDFDPDDDPHLIAEDARAIDSAIDMYNDAIEASFAEARGDGLDWRILDVAGLLDRLASRRYLDDPTAARPDWLTPYELPSELATLVPPPDSRFFASAGDGRTSGGLFSLDGIHPTTITYGLIAQELIDVMREAGVEFVRRDGVTPRGDEVRVDWQRLIALDTLISSPPGSLSGNLRLIGWLDERIDVVRRLWGSLL